MKQATTIVTDALLAFSLFALAPFAWILRDGLGPDAITSSGISAIARWFMTFGRGRF